MVTGPTRHISLAVLLALSAGQALAGSTLAAMPLGQDLSLAGASHGHSIQPLGNNPAAPAAADTERMRFGLGAVAAGYELGSLDNISDRIDELEEELDREFASMNEAEEAKERIDRFLRDLGRDGYVKLAAGGQPPMMPLDVGLPRIGGRFSLGLSAVGAMRVSFLDAPIEVVSTGSGEYELQSRTSGYIKGAGGTVLSLGYSADALHHRDGTLVVGGRLNRYDMELGKAVAAIEDGDEDEDDFDDALEDDFERNRRDETAMGLDLGLLWKTPTYQLGATLRNVNEPQLRYPRIGRNCDALDGASATNCHTAASFGDRISLAETHTLERQLQLEGALFSANRRWSLAGTWDLNASRDITGDENQWHGINAAYAGRGWWVPGARLGYRSNRGGSELSLITGGLTFFRLLNLDVAMATDSVDDDGSSLPRAAMASLSLEFRY